ncbi:protein maelstrom homolog [Maniola jurtina]|uniref:protein maelstrom homolog n=1 Tax=Maniola jurtina TaxID=191418 RepID=UPI001E68D770|nr:protein maelstrom homolog [Maniola jurtina]
MVAAVCISQTSYCCVFLLIQLQKEVPTDKMPKKTTKNSFYFFMVDFKEQQRKKGINYANMNEVGSAAGPVWEAAPPAVRAKFEAIAKKEKQKYNIPECKYTSQGVSLAQIDREAEELQRAIEDEQKDIKNMVTKKGLDCPALDLHIFVMDVNCYCKASRDYVVGETALMQFNIRNGIQEAYHTIINPGNIPIGYASDVKYGSVELGLDMPDESKERTDYISVLANTIDYLKKNIDKNDRIPALFTMPDKVAPLTNFLQQMCRRAGEDDTIFRVYQLDRLFYTMVNFVRLSEDAGFPKESLALNQLKKDPFKYNPGLACQHHEVNDKAVECCLSRVRRWAYTFLDTACPAAGIVALPGKHLPADFDIEQTQIFQEQKKTRLPPSVWREPNSCDASPNTSFNLPVEPSTSKVVKRVHVPLRRPKSNFPDPSCAEVPELTDLDFPHLSRVSRGPANVENTFNKLNINE